MDGRSRLCFEAYSSTFRRFLSRSSSKMPTSQAVPMDGAASHELKIFATPCFASSGWEVIFKFLDRDLIEERSSETGSYRSMSVENVCGLYIIGIRKHVVSNLRCAIHLLAGD